jgi:hypothetical protein
MLKINEVKPLENYFIFIRFEDGKEGNIDLSHLKGKGVFKAWDELTYFNSVSIDENSGTVTWFNEIDLDPDVLYSKLTGQKIEDVLNITPGKVA